MFRQIFLIVCASACISQLEAACPTVMRRQSWGALPPKLAATTNRNGLQLAIVHHSDTPICTTQHDCYRRIRSIQTSHMEDRGWDDIGYNFLISSAGDIYAGRGWGAKGFHTPGYNSQSIGVCMIGNYEDSLPTPEAMTALWNLLECAVTKGYLSSDYKVIGHKQAVPASKSPGSSLYSELKKSSKWTSEPSLWVGPHGPHKKN